MDREAARVALAAFQREMLTAILSSRSVREQWAGRNLVRYTPALFGHSGSRSHGRNVRAAVTRRFPLLSRSLDLSDDVVARHIPANPTSLDERAAIERWAESLDALLSIRFPDAASPEVLRDLLFVERAVALARVVPVESIDAAVRAAQAIGPWPENARVVEGAGIFTVATHTNAIDLLPYYPAEEAVAFGATRWFAFFSLDGERVRRVRFNSPRELAVSIGMQVLL